MVMGLSLRLLMFFGEFFLYFLLYKSMREQNEKIKDCLSRKALTKRYKKNTITLQGQAFSFAISALFWLLVSATQIMSSTFQLRPYILVVLGVFHNGFSNVSLFISSPELRRKHLGNDDIWLPEKLKKYISRLCDMIHQ